LPEVRFALSKEPLKMYGRAELRRVLLDVAGDVEAQLLALQRIRTRNEE
jgi:hypothetical protein